MATGYESPKAIVEAFYRQGVLWCTACLQDLTPHRTWLADDRHDTRLLCYDCAPGDAIRAKDLT